MTRPLRVAVVGAGDAAERNRTLLERPDPEAARDRGTEAVAGDQERLVLFLLDFLPHPKSIIVSNPRLVFFGGYFI